MSFFSQATRSTSCRRAGIRRTAFSGGHTAVSAVWGLLGLTLLYIGLRTKRSALRLGGLALLGISLAKLFVYDLSRLSSIIRALSLLAVGAVLLLGGFFTSGSGPAATTGSRRPRNRAEPSAVVLATAKEAM